MATAKPKSTKSPPAALARLYRPGVLERGLKIIAKEQDEAAAEKDGPTVLAASGDSGVADVELNGTTYYTHRVTSWPDSDPLVTGVGARSDL